MNYDNDKLYEELDAFMSMAFADEEAFYEELVAEVGRLQKKYKVQFTPYEYIFIMRMRPGLVFGCLNNLDFGFPPS